MKKYIVPMISMCGLISCSLGICSNVQGVFFADAARDLNVMIGTFSMQNTMACIITYVLAIYFAGIAEKVPYRPLLLAGAAMTALSFIGTGLTRSIPIFYLLGVVRGVGASVFAVAIVTIGINNWFKEKTGLITSIVFCTSGLTGMILSPVFARIIELSSWRTAYIVMGIVSFLLILPAILSNFTPDPAQSGRVPYGSAPGETKTVERPVETGSEIRKVFLLLAGMTVIHNMVLGFAQHLPGYAAETGLSVEAGALLLSMCMLGNITFKLLSGLAADRQGAVRTTLYMQLLNLAAILLLFLIWIPWVQKLSAFFYGVMYSVATVCTSLLTMEYSSREAYSRIYPKISMLGGIINPLSITLWGYLYDWSHTYRLVLELLILLHAVALILLYRLGKCKKMEC